jgi:hypothetical protein
MQRRDFLKTSASFAVTPAFLPKLSLAQAIATPPPLPAPGADGWVSLINGRDLTGWYTMLAKSGKGFAEKYKMVTMEEEMLHIMGNEEGVTPAETGYVATKQEFENVHIRVEYKWGVKRHAPRNTPKRDNGLLYGLVGEDRVWPLCVECQIEEGDVGDFFMVGTRGIQSSHFGGLFGEGISPVTGWPKPGGARVDPQLGGTWPTHELPPPGMLQTQTEPTSGRFIKDGNFELLDEWNTVEVLWQGDKAAHIVNGRTVNVVTNLQQPDPQNAGKYIPLTRGKIAIEIEYAEIWFRRIEVKSLV